MRERDSPSSNSTSLVRQGRSDKQRLAQRLDQSQECNAPSEKCRVYEIVRNYQKSIPADHF